MNQKQRQRLGSAIASTILSVFSAVSLVGVDQAQAAVLTYNVNHSNLSFFKVNNSSLRGIGYESIAVSEGRLYDYTLGVAGAKEYYDLAGASVGFYQGEFRGLNTSGYDQAIVEFDEINKLDYRVFWSIFPYPTGPTTSVSVVTGYREVIYYPYQDIDRRMFNYDEVYYTLVDTAAEPVPEPLAVGGTVLALAGLSWLKQKKKMAA